MPANITQLLLEISRHQEEYNRDGKGLKLELGIASQMEGRAK